MLTTSVFVLRELRELQLNGLFLVWFFHEEKFVGNNTAFPIFREMQADQKSLPRVLYFYKWYNKSDYSRLLLSLFLFCGSGLRSKINVHRISYRHIFS